MSEPSTSAMASPPTPSPKKRRKKKNPILDFLTEESNKEESEAKTERFLGLFEKMVDKL